MAGPVLILGGTTEAYELATCLVDAGYRVITSLAGRTRAPRVPDGELRVGGFGGSQGLARYLTEQRISALLDATHPFAALMPHHAATAATAAGVPRVRLYRPGWTADPAAGDRWVRVATLEAAATALVERGATRVLLTTGRQELAPFRAAQQQGVHFVVRCIEAPDPDVLPGAEVLLARGPFSVADEVRLLREHAIDAVVTKDAGAAATAAKLVAARQLGIGVVMVNRPPQPAGDQVPDVQSACAWLAALPGSAEPSGSAEMSG